MKTAEGLPTSLPQAVTQEGSYSPLLLGPGGALLSSRGSIVGPWRSLSWALPAAGFFLAKAAFFSDPLSRGIRFYTSTTGATPNINQFSIGQVVGALGDLACWYSTTLGYTKVYTLYPDDGALSTTLTEQYGVAVSSVDNYVKYLFNASMATTLTFNYALMY